MIEAKITKEENKRVAKIKVEGDLETILNDLSAITIGILTDLGEKSGNAPIKLFDAMSDQIQQNLILQMMKDILGISNKTKN